MAANLELNKEIITQINSPLTSRITSAFSHQIKKALSLTPDPNVALNDRNDIQKDLAKEGDLNLYLTQDYKFNSEAFAQYMKARESLAENLGDVFKNPEHIKIINDPGFKEIFSPPPTLLSDSAAKFEKEAKQLQDIIATRSKIEPTLTTMHNIITHGIKAIEAQQTTELREVTKKINEVYQHPSYTKEKIQEIQDNMLHALSEKHKEQKKVYSDLVIAAEREAHQAIQADRDNHYFLVMLAKNNPQMNKIIQDELARLNPSSTTDNLSLQTFSPQDEDKDIGYIRLIDLGVIYTKAGSEIKQDNGQFTLAVAGFGTGSLYLLQETIKDDLRTLAEAVKATGKKSIIMDVDGFMSQEIALRRAKQAYEASIEAGFPPDKITVRINKKEQTLEQLFGKDSAVPEQLRTRSEVVQEQDKQTKIKIDNDPFASQEYKKIVQENNRLVQQQEKEKKKEAKKEEATSETTISPSTSSN